MKARSPTRLAWRSEAHTSKAGVGFPPDLQGRPSGDYHTGERRDISRLGRTAVEDDVVDRHDHFVKTKTPTLPRDLWFRNADPGVAWSLRRLEMPPDHRVIAGINASCSGFIRPPHGNGKKSIPTLTWRYLVHFLRTDGTSTISKLRWATVRAPKSDLSAIALYRSLTPPRAAADCGDPGQSGRAARQAPRRPRPTRHPHPIHLPRHVRRPHHESEGVACSHTCDALIAIRKRCEC